MFLVITRDVTLQNQKQELHAAYTKGFKIFFTSFDS